MSEKLYYSCPCIFGLESVLAGEIKRMGGAEEITVSDGRVDFSGSPELIARANLWLRTAERVLIVLGRFRAESFSQLFEETVRLPFERFIGKYDAFPVKGWSLNSQLHSIPDCQSIVKKAAVKRLEQKYGISWFEETGSIHQIQFSILKNQVTIMLDTSGQGLHKRGYRRQSNEAPIKETLAAGILDLVRIFPDTQLYDPMCGSGTFLIESAYKAKNIAPGLYRHFSAERWDCFMPEMWKEERERARGLIRKGSEVSFHAFGSDRDPACAALSAENARKAGVAPSVSVSTAELRDFVPPCERSVVVCNPPYGERMLQTREIYELYRTMGQVFTPNEHTGYFIISSVDEFEELFGRKADKRRKLYNGMVKCQLYLYFPLKSGK